MRVQEQAQGVDLVQVLIGEEGKFIATSPDGGTFVVECRNGHSLTKLQHLQAGSGEQYGVPPIQGAWNVKKIAQIEGSQYGSQGYSSQGQPTGQQQQPRSQQQDRQQQDRQQQQDFQR